MDGAADLRRGEAASPLANTDAYALLYEFSARLMEKHELSELLEELMDAVIELTRADKGFLILTEGDVFDVKVARNLQRENIADAIHQLSDSIVAKVVESQRPVIVSDAMNDDEFSSSKSVMKLQLTSVICVPLLEKGPLLGILYVGNDSVRELFAEETLRVLTIFAAQASLIVANALHLRHLQVDNRALSERPRGDPLWTDHRHLPGDAWKSTAASKRWPPPISPFSSPARRAPEKSSSPAKSTSALPAQTPPSSRSTAAPSPRISSSRSSSAT